MANPLDRSAKDAQPGGAGKVTAESLYEYADRLNKMPFVQIQGKPYFVSKRDKPGCPGEIEHFLDRHA